MRVLVNWGRIPILFNKRLSNHDFRHRRRRRALQRAGHGAGFRASQRQAGAAYEVEFLSLDGNTIGVSTVEAADLRQASGRAVLHERELLAD